MSLIVCAHLQASATAFPNPPLLGALLRTPLLMCCPRFSMCCPAGIGYGLYLTLSSWALYFVATRTDFFDGQIGMFSLQEGSVRFPGNWPLVCCCFCLECALGTALPSLPAS